jgi:hypothetical protein
VGFAVGFGHGLLTGVADRLVTDAKDVEVRIPMNDKVLRSLVVGFVPAMLLGFATSCQQISDSPVVDAAMRDLRNGQVSLGSITIPGSFDDLRVYHPWVAELLVCPTAVREVLVQRIETELHRSVKSIGSSTGGPPDMSMLLLAEALAWAASPTSASVMNEILESADLTDDASLFFWRGNYVQYAYLYRLRVPDLEKVSPELVNLSSPRRALPYLWFMERTRAVPREWLSLLVDMEEDVCTQKYVTLMGKENALLFYYRLARALGKNVAWLEVLASLNASQNKNNLFGKCTVLGLFNGLLSQMDASSPKAASAVMLLYDKADSFGLPAEVRDALLNQIEAIASKALQNIPDSLVLSLELKDAPKEVLGKAIQEAIARSPRCAFFLDEAGCWPRDLQVLLTQPSNEMDVAELPYFLLMMVRHQAREDQDNIWVRIQELRTKERYTSMFENLRLGDTWDRQLVERVLMEFVSRSMPLGR